MSEENRDETYGRLMREFRELQLGIDVSRSKLKRIGENLRGFGDSLIHQPGLNGLDRQSFQADTSTVFDLLQQHDALQAKLADKGAELSKFGPIPRFD